MIWYHSVLWSLCSAHQLPSVHLPSGHCLRSTPLPIRFVQVSSVGTSPTVFPNTGTLHPSFCNAPLKPHARLITISRKPSHSPKFLSLFRSFFGLEVQDQAWTGDCNSHRFNAQNLHHSSAIEGLYSHAQISEKMLITFQLLGVQMFGTSKDGTLFARVGISRNPNVSFKICFIFQA